MIFLKIFVIKEYGNMKVLGQLVEDAINEEDAVNKAESRLTLIEKNNIVPCDFVILLENGESKTIYSVNDLTNCKLEGEALRQYAASILNDFIRGLEQLRRSILGH